MPNFSLGNLEPIYLKVAGEPHDNAAIVAFSTEVNPEKPGRVQAFGRLENYAAAETTVEASLFLNDTLLDAKKVTLPARDPQNGLPGASGVNRCAHVAAGMRSSAVDAIGTSGRSGNTW